MSGYSHVGLATHDMEKTIWFYREVLGFAVVAENRATVTDGGTVHLVYFDIGDGCFIVFMQGMNVPSIPDDFDTGINGQLGVPRGMYHYAFKEVSQEGLFARQRQLEQAGLEVSALVDHGYAQAIYVLDPNGIQIEFCWQCRPFGLEDLQQSAIVSMGGPVPSETPA